MGGCSVDAGLAENIVSVANIDGMASRNLDCVFSALKVAEAKTAAVECLGVL